MYKKENKNKVEYLQKRSPIIYKIGTMSTSPQCSPLDHSVLHKPIVFFHDSSSLSDSSTHACMVWMRW